MHIPRIKKCVSLLLKLPEGLLIRTKMQTQMRADDLCCLLPPFFGYQPAACRSLEVLIMPILSYFFGCSNYAINYTGVSSPCPGTADICATTYASKLKTSLVQHSQVKVAVYMSNFAFF